MTDDAYERWAAGYAGDDAAVPVPPWPRTARPWHLYGVPFYDAPGDTVWCGATVATAVPGDWTWCAARLDVAEIRQHAEQHADGRGWEE